MHADKKGVCTSITITKIQFGYDTNVRPGTFIRDQILIQDPIRSRSKSGYPEKSNPDLDNKILNLSNPDMDILIF